MSVFTVVLTFELELLKILLNASSVLPFNNSDSIGSVGTGTSVAVLLLKVVLDSVLELGAIWLIMVVAPAPSGIDVLLTVVLVTFSAIRLATFELIDGTVTTSSVVEEVRIILVGLLAVVLGIVVVLVLGVMFVLLGDFIVVVVELILFNDSALASKDWGVVCSAYKVNRKHLYGNYNTNIIPAVDKVK